jgi:hypothetical protein
MLWILSCGSIATTETLLHILGDKKVGNIKLQIARANILIHRFDAAQESGNLADGEWWLRKTLKLTVLGLSSLERTIARQGLRMRWLKDGTLILSCSMQLQMVAEPRTIPAIKRDGELIADQEPKEELFFQAYQRAIGQHSKSRAHA